METNSAQNKIEGEKVIFSGVMSAFALIFSLGMLYETYDGRILTVAPQSLAIYAMLGLLEEDNGIESKATPIGSGFVQNNAA